MVANTDEEAEKMRKRIWYLKLSYLIVWLLLWGTQRTAEALTINKKMQAEENVSGYFKYMLWSSNILELIIELALYAALIKISLSFSRFLSSYDATYERHTAEYKII